MLFILFSFIFSKTTSDLKPPFETDKDGNVGYWEFGGSAGVRDDYILLVPPIQYNRGSAWTNVALPKGTWSLVYNLQIHEGSGGGGFAIWFIDKYGGYGQIRGGPQQFRGIGLVGDIVTNENRSHSLKFSFLQNKGNVVFNPQELPNQLFYKFSRNNTITIKIRFSGENVDVFVTDGGKKEAHLYSEKVKVDMDELFAGITANTDAYTSRIDIKTVKFKLGKNEEEQKPNVDENGYEIRKASMSVGSKEATYQPETMDILRNPVFFETKKVLSEYMNVVPKMPKDQIVSGVTSASRILNVINEMFYASTDVSSFSELNEYIKGTLTKYAEKWHKRTVKMIENVKKSRDIFGLAFNYTEAIVNNFNSTVSKASIKTALKVIDLGELISQVVENDIEENDAETAIISSNSKIVQIMVIGAIVEFFLLVLFIVLLQNKNIQSKFFG